MISTVTQGVNCAVRERDASATRQLLEGLPHPQWLGERLQSLPLLSQDDEPVGERVIFLMPVWTIIVAIMLAVRGLAPPEELSRPNRPDVHGTSRALAQARRFPRESGEITLWL
jgi:hypothetical protein